MVTSFQLWSAVIIIFGAFCYFYTEEVSNILDWLALRCASILVETRLTLWKIYLGPRLRLETWLMRRRAQARLSAHYRTETTKQKGTNDRQV